MLRPSHYRNQSHIVLDIETLGLRHDCVILQIGAVKVKNGLMTKELDLHFDVAAQLQDKHWNEESLRDFSDTFLWWIADEKRLSQFKQILTFKPPYIERQKNTLLDFLKTSGAALLWTKHCFDYMVLMHLFDRKPEGIEYWRWRDIATLENPAFLPDGFVPKENPHDALEDAKNEAEILIAALWPEKLGETK